MPRLEHLPRPVRAAIGAALLVDGWHTCPGGCGARVSPGHVACRSCWLRVPRRLRAPLVDAFRGRNTDRAAYAAAIAEAERLVNRYAPPPGGGEEPTR